LALAAKPFFDPGRESTRRQTGNLHLAFKARDTYRATIREAHIVFDLAQRLDAASKMSLAVGTITRGFYFR
jgi:hypothetical protein